VAGYGSAGILYAIERWLFLFGPPIGTNPFNAGVYSLIGYFIIAVIIQSFLVGIIAPQLYAVGFLLGDGVVIYYLNSSLFSDFTPSPIVITAISMLFVIVCLIARLFLSKIKKGDFHNVIEHHR